MSFHKRKCLVKSVCSPLLTDNFQCNEIRFVLTEPTLLNLIATALVNLQIFHYIIDGIFPFHCKEY